MVDVDETTNAVDLDQLFNTLDPKTRKGLQGRLRGFGSWYVGQSDNLQKTFKYLGPSFGNLSRVMEELGRDQKTFEHFIVNAAKAVTAIASRRDDLAELVTNGTGFARALGDENVALDQALAGLPGVLRAGQCHVPRRCAPALSGPERADRRVEAAHQGPGAVPAATSRTCSGRCDRRSRTCARSSTSPGRATTRST